MGYHVVGTPLFVVSFEATTNELTLQLLSEEHNDIL